MFFVKALDVNAAVVRSHVTETERPCFFSRCLLVEINPQSQERAQQTTY